MKIITATAILCVALTMGGCKAYTLAPAGKPIVVANAFKATPIIDWSRVQTNNVEIWTVDGPQLEKITFLSGIEDGSPLSPKHWLASQLKASTEGEASKFHKDMGSIEIAELVKETFNRSGYQKFTINNIQPDRFVDNDGVRFDFTFLTNSGLDKEGFAIATVIEEKLHIAIYTGTKEYYFKKYKDTVEQTLRNLSLKNGT
ncbi:MAG: hypothetical protein JKY27_00635 [Magnetovibrio sp.]|nr:hypothetical protein [Magnetovibrio sp.]